MCVSILGWYRKYNGHRRMARRLPFTDRISWLLPIPQKQVPWLTEASVCWSRPCLGRQQSHITHTPPTTH